MKPSPIRLLAQYLRPQWQRVSLMVALLVGGVAFQAYGPQVLRQFIDQVTGKADPQILVRTAWVFLLVVVLGQIISALGAYASAMVGWEATNHLRADLVRHCLRLDMRFHHSHLSGELMERVDGDPGLLGNFFSQFAVQIAANGVLALVILGLILQEDFRTGLLLFLYMGLAFVFLLRMQKIGARTFDRLRAIQTRAVGFWEEMLTAREDVKPLGALGYVLWRDLTYQREMYRDGRLSSVYFRAYVAEIAAVFVIGNALAFALGADLYSRGAITLGSVYLLLAYTNMLAANVGNLASQSNDFQQAVIAIQRVSELTVTANPLADGPGSPRFGPAPEVVFENVSFAYSDAAPILKNVSFRLESGKTLGLIGRTGSGKSTIVRLLFRFYDPDTGSISLDGVDIRKARLADLRGGIGMVAQEVQLFHATARDNLTLFDENIPDEQVRSVLAGLGLDPWLGRLPEGLDTQLSGESGLSAGEAQLLSLARVFLQEPGLVILDEASSHLDLATEAVLERSFNRLIEGRTAIIVAHRLSTLQRVDRILILEDGRVLESGSRRALLEDPSSQFSRLLRTGIDLRLNFPEKQVEEGLDRPG